VSAPFSKPPAPVDTDDLVSGALTFLRTQPGVLAALSTTDAGTPMLFQHRLFVRLEGTGAIAAVIGRGGGWSSANDYNTARFPRLSLEIWADPIRGGTNHVRDPGEVWRRIEAAFVAFDRVLHRTSGGVQWWGTVRTISSTRNAEPLTYVVPDGDGMLRTIAYYAVQQA
jgi:hypothetical protein